MKKIIQPTVIILLVIVALLFVTGNGFVFQMVSKVLETGRTTAGIDDHLFFDNIEIPPSEQPQAWPLHKDFNTATSPASLNSLHIELGTVAFLIVKTIRCGMNNILMAMTSVLKAILFRSLKQSLRLLCQRP